MNPEKQEKAVNNNNKKILDWSIYISDTESETESDFPILEDNYKINSKLKISRLVADCFCVII